MCQRIAVAIDAGNAFEHRDMPMHTRHDDGSKGAIQRRRFAFEVLDGARVVIEQQAGDAA